PGTVTSFVAGCAAWSRWPAARLNGRGDLVVNGGVIALLLGAGLWFSHETGRSVPLLPLVFYGAGLVALLAASAFAARTLAGGRVALKFPALTLCAFAGMAGGGGAGNFLALALRDLPPAIWAPLTFIQPAERLAFALCAAFIALPLLESLPKIGVRVGPQLAERDPPEDG
ncbi:MAG: hypothetical protein FWE09_04345, partial [Treponema sp.]|nr:hypothetical protein [Treponema sp.]